VPLFGEKVVLSNFSQLARDWTGMKVPAVAAVCTAAVVCPSCTNAFSSAHPSGPQQQRIFKGEHYTPLVSSADEGFAAPSPGAVGKGTQSRESQIKTMKQGLEMQWGIRERKAKPATPAEASYRCASCEGIGRKECRFCGGAKSIKLGANSEAMECPVCKARGVEPCSVCHGAGRIASWMKKH
jgi:hypothetical protein